jgi:metallo-beta-lactamase class B
MPIPSPDQADHHSRPPADAGPSRFARQAGLAAILLASCSPGTAQPALPEGPPTAEFLAACEGKEGWADPSPPLRIHGNVYHVGTCGITALLIASDAGHVLIDTGPEEAAPLVAANVQRLGFELADIEWIVTSHEHHDHVGGVAELKRLTGARLAARAAAQRPLQTGTPDWRDPQTAVLDPFPGAPVERVMRDGEHLVLGQTDLTMHATPGHSPGSTTWTWVSCAGSDCRSMVYADSLSAASADGFRFSAVPTYVAAFRRSLDKVATLECEILLTPHPGASALHARVAGRQPLVDPQACRSYAQGGRERLDARLAQEQR